MSRMKTFLIYLILFIAFYIFVDVIVGMSITSTYYDLEVYKDNLGEYNINISDAKVTTLSGYLEGTIALNENADKNQYLRVDLYSKYGNRVGRRYVKLDSLNAGEQKDFKVNFEYDNITNCHLEVTDNKEALEPIQEDMVAKGYWAMNVVGVLIVLMYVI